MFKYVFNVSLPYAFSAVVTCSAKYKICHSSRRLITLSLYFSRYIIQYFCSPLQYVNTVSYTDSGCALWLRSGFSISNQIIFDLRFPDLQLTWCSELIVDQLCFVFPCIFDLQLRDRRLVDRPSIEPTLCQSDWLTVTSICGVVLMGMRHKQ